MNLELLRLRESAKKYAEIAHSSKNLERPDLYRQLNSLKQTKPPVLVFEVPWGEFSDHEDLKVTSEDPLLRGIEINLKRNLFQFAHFEGDYAVHPYYGVKVRLKNSGIGLTVKEKTISSTTGAYISAHEYHDVLSDEKALDNIKTPVIEIDEQATDMALDAACTVFDNIMDVKIKGEQFYFATWDELPRYHGVENCLIDIYDRPGFMHKIVEIFTKNHEAVIEQYEKLNILETDPYYLHCTPACTYELTVKDMTKEKITAKDVWARGMAQIFAVVSPGMHYEFDIKYMKRLFDRCGLSYYGCCEPLDTKIDMLKNFDNLRRISITPWADANIAADAMQSDYVLSAKTNPAFVAHGTFDPEPVIAEVKKIVLACKRNNTPFEFILKDISTVSNNFTNLTKWVNTVENTIQKYLYG